MQIKEDKLKEYIERITPGACPLCHSHKDWSMPGEVFQAFSLTKGKPSPKVIKKTLPILPLFCLNCGYTYFINPFVAGILTPEEIRDAEGSDQTE